MLYYCLQYVIAAEPLQIYWVDAYSFYFLFVSIVLARYNAIICRSLSLDCEMRDDSTWPFLKWMLEIEQILASEYVVKSVPSFKMSKGLGCDGLCQRGPMRAVTSQAWPGLQSYSERWPGSAAVV